MRNPVLAVSLLGSTVLWGAVAVLSAAQNTPVRPVAASPAVTPARVATAPAATGQSANEALLKQYCVTCHNARLKTGGLELDGLDMTKLPEHAETWEKVVRKVR